MSMLNPKLQLSLSMEMREKKLLQMNMPGEREKGYLRSKQWTNDRTRWEGFWKTNVIENQKWLPLCALYFEST